MKILSEANCARKYRRLTSPMNVSVGGRVLPTANWSPGGILVRTEAESFVKDRIDAGELLIPCLDGIFSVAVQIHPIHRSAAGWGCKFVDMPPRERAILHFFADSVARGVSVYMGELDEAGQAAQALEPPPAAVLEEETSPPVSRALARFPIKRIAVVAALLLAIGGIGSFVVPYFLASLLNKLNAKNEYLEVANGRLQTAELSLADLDAKIGLVQKLLREDEGKGAMGSDQRRLLELGLSQLQTEQKMKSLRVKMLRDNVSAVQKGSFFFEQSSLLDNSANDLKSDSAPYLSEILNDRSAASRLEPRTTEEANKFLLVAQTRVKDAEYARKSTQIRREALEKIVSRAVQSGPLATFPLNQLDLMRRDIALYKVEEDRLANLLTLLHDNVSAIQRGDYTYELRLLQRYDPQSSKAADANDVNPLTTTR